MSRSLARFGFASLSVCLACCFASAPAHGQAFLVRSGGAMGGPLVHTASTKEPAPAFLIYSTGAGPTALGDLYPGDPRFLDLSLDAEHFLTVTPFPAGPEGQVLFLGLPALLNLIGYQVRAQFITLSQDGFYPVGEISNWTGTVIGPSGFQHLTQTERHYATDGHTATLLSDGRVLLAGGIDLSAGGVVTAGTEYYDAQQQGFVPGSALPTPRAGHVATLLQDGRVLLTGGVGSNGDVRRTAVLVDPVAGTAVPAAPMARRRIGHSATRMPDGRVVVVGGVSNLTSGGGSGAAQSAESTTEVYDPTTDMWSFGPSLPQRRVGHGAALDGAGRLLLAGGFLSPVGSGVCLANCITGSALLISDQGGVLSLHGTESMPRALALMTFQATAEGNVLAVGGLEAQGTGFAAVPSVLRFDFKTGTWEPLPDLEVPRIEPSVVPGAGGYAVIGGLSGDLISLPDTLYVLSKSLSGFGQFGGPDPPEEISSEPSIELRDVDFGEWKIKDPPKKFPMVELRQRALSLAVDGGSRVLTTGASLDGTTGPSLVGEVLIW
jgi:hypothetical protein